MAQPKLVTVLDICRVAPTPHSLNSAAKTIPLTFFDVFWLRFSPTQRLFFYESPHPITTLSDTILPKLKHSLSVTLQHYISLTGNLMWPPNSGKPTIQYHEGDTVSLIVAESDAEFFHDLSGNDFRDAKKFHHFLPNLLASETRVPVMALQVTLFPNAGFSIGYAAHHAVLDGKSIAMFMHSWASICRRGGDSTLMPELTPSYDRTIINDPSNLENVYLNSWLAYNGPNNRSLVFWEDFKAPPDAVFGTFQLTQTNIESIKQWVKAKWQEKHKKKPAFHPSTFTITSAYTWICLIKTKKLMTEKVQLGISVDCRPRLETPVPSTYFGNCITVRITHADTNQLMGEDGVVIAATAIGETIRALDDGILKGAEGLISNFLSIEKEGLFSTAGSPRFEFYNTDFGWGKPKKVEMISIEKTGALSLSDTRDGNGGVEIGVVLKKHETEAFASLFASGLEAHQAHEN